MEILLRSVSLNSVTTLFVLALAPLFLLWEWGARRRKLQESPSLPMATALTLLSMLLGWLLLKPALTSLPLGGYFVLSVAELLSVPISMSVAALLSPPTMQCTGMGLYYFLIGVAVWVPRLWPRASVPLVAVLMIVAAVLAVLIGRMDWRGVMGTSVRRRTGRAAPAAEAALPSPQGRQIARVR